MSHDQPRRREEAPPLYAVAPSPPAVDVQDDVPPGFETAAEPLEPEGDESGEEHGDLLPAVREDLTPAVRGGLAPAVPLEGKVVPWERQDEAQPIIAEWLKDADQRLEAGWWVLRRARHTVLFHLVRSPIYVARTVWYAPRGLIRTSDAWRRWAFDAEGKPLRSLTIEQGETRDYVKLTHLRNERVKLRLIVTAGLATAATSMVSTAWWYWSATPDLVLAAATAVLGYLGRRLDRPFIAPALLPPDIPIVTLDIVMEAFIGAGLCKEDNPISFVAPGVARDGDGFLVMLDLPKGKTAVDAVKKLPAIAGGLDRDEVEVFIDRVRGRGGSSRRISMWIADCDPYAELPPVTPLAEVEKLDFWSPFPFGVDARGRVVMLTLIWSSLLIGAIPRQGKTFAARLPAAAAALDPFMRLIVFNGKGDGAWKAFKQVAHRYGSGIRESVVLHLLEVLEEIQADMDDRNDRMAEMPDDLCPDSKLTQPMARNKHLNMPPALIAIDEVHRYIEHKVHGKRILELLIDIAKVGPSAGYMLVLATQRPDADVIPPNLSGVIGVRFALKVMSYHASNVILGPGASKAGYDSSLLLRPHKGVGILLGMDDTEQGEDDAQTVRTHFANNETIAAICARGRELRIAAGTLTGVAAGEEHVVEQEAVRSLLDDVLAVFVAGEERLWSTAVCERLAAAAPAVYDGWDATALANALKPYGVSTEVFWGRLEGDETRKGTSRSGVYREHVLEALARRHG